MTGATARLASPPGRGFLDTTLCGDRRGHIYVATESTGYNVRRYDIASDTWSYFPFLPFNHGGGAPAR